MAPPAGAGAGVGAVGSSDWQPVAKESASTRLETIMLALIPNLIVTDALLEKRVNEVRFLKLALPGGTCVWVVGLLDRTGDDLSPFRQRDGL
jgi:hypothetical protein